MYLNASSRLNELPPEYPESLISSIRTGFLQSEKTIVVLDDDPTGTQTCYDTIVLISWQTDLIAEELEKKPSILFILTNSRSLTGEDAVALTLEVGRNLREAVRRSGREVVIVSRSDSTLRGHFPSEVDAIATAMDIKEYVTVLLPAFIEGRRFTIDNVHYIVENDKLIPVSDTPFAKDVVFGYSHSDLRDWVEEKTKGSINASEVRSVSLWDIRIGGPAVVNEKLMACRNGDVCVVNAAGYRDIEVFVKAAIDAEVSGKKFLYRTSATFVPIRAGLESGKIYVPGRVDESRTRGSLIVVGSHVPKTTGQLAWLLEHHNLKAIEINVTAILAGGANSPVPDSIAGQADEWLASGHDVVIYTSRRLEVGTDKSDSLKINAAVSGFLVDIVKQITVRPVFIVAKGGITSSDLASKALSAKKATVLGPVIPGVPLWKMDEKSRFPGIRYVVFPGNVGDETALADVCNRLRNIAAD